MRDRMETARVPPVAPRKASENVSKDLYEVYLVCKKAPGEDRKIRQAERANEHETEGFGNRSDRDGTGSPVSLFVGKRFLSEISGGAPGVFTAGCHKLSVS